MDPSLWPYRWPHEAPDEPLSIIEAHQATQRHRNCSPENCGRKAAAINALRLNGRLVPELRMAEVCR